MKNKISVDSLSGSDQEAPWYRQFWPWFIMALPATVVVAGFFTLYLAIVNSDYPVTEDDLKYDSLIREQADYELLKESGSTKLSNSDLGSSDPGSSD